MPACPRPTGSSSATDAPPAFCTAIHPSRGFRCRKLAARGVGQQEADAGRCRHPLRGGGTGQDQLTACWASSRRISSVCLVGVAVEGRFEIEAIRVRGEARQVGLELLSLQPAATSMGTPHTGGIEGLQHEFSSIEEFVWRRHCLDLFEAGPWSMISTGLPWSDTIQTRKHDLCHGIPDAHGRDWSDTSLAWPRPAPPRPPARLLCREPELVRTAAQKSSVRGSLVSARPWRKRVSATQAASKSPRCRDSSMPCGRGVRIADGSDQDRRAGERVGELGDQTGWSRPGRRAPARGPRPG